MRHMATTLFHLSTFRQFSKSNTEQSHGLLQKSTLLAYLLTSHIALLHKKEFDKAQRDRQYAHMTYDQKAELVQQQFLAMREDLKQGQRVSSAKDTTHQFAEKVIKPQHRLESRFLNKALINGEDCFVDVEANTTFGELIKRLNKAGYRVPLVPEFLDITVGGAFVGVAIESSGHEFGLFHEHVLQAEVLMPDGSLKTMSLRDYKEEYDQFRALPNSYGTLGRIMRLRLPLISLDSRHERKRQHPFLDERKAAYLASPEPDWLTNHVHHLRTQHHPSTDHVQLRYHRYTDTETALAELKRLSELSAHDFIESVVVSPDNVVIITGDIVKSVNDIPPEQCHSYRERDIFWQHVKDPKHTENYVPLNDYYARWHQTVFWNTQTHDTATKLFNHPIFRRLFGRFMGPGFLAMLSSAKDYWDAHTANPTTTPKQKTEHMVQDIGIPQSRAPEFAKWYQEEIGLYPVWLCPVKSADGTFPSFHPKADDTYVDWGMFTGDGKPEHPSNPKYYTDLIEQKMAELGGHKTLYSDNADDRERFDELNRMEFYDRMKAEMDPDNIYPHVYDKMVSAQHSQSISRKPHLPQLPFSYNAFMTWVQCIAVSSTATMITGTLLAQPALNTIALSAAIGLSAHQLSSFIAKKTRIDSESSDAFARGISGWVSVSLVAAAFTVIQSTGFNSLALAAALLVPPITNGVMKARASVKQESPALRM